MKLVKMNKGFTLIELMIVVAIIGILASIAIPQFANLVAKSQEGATKGNLGTIRSALSIYYGDTEGVYPSEAISLASLTAAGKYLQLLPTATTPKTNQNAGHASGNPVANSQTDAGGWYYNNVSASATWGQLNVNCSHSDVKGSIWTSY